MPRLIAAFLTTSALMLLAIGQPAHAATEIDILFAYTEEALGTRSFNGDEEELKSAVERRIQSIHNNAYADHGIEVVLVPHFYKTDWDEEASHNMAWMYQKMRVPDDGHLDDIFHKREEVGADLVVLFIYDSTSSGHTLGVAYTNGLLGLTSTIDQPVLEDAAYAVVRSTSFGTFHHEIQHLMGLNHDKIGNFNRSGPVINENASTVAAFRNPEPVWDVTCPSQCTTAELQDAIDAAPPLATLRIGPGRYFGSLNVDKRLHLIGAGARVTVLDGDGTSRVVDVSGQDVTLERLTITGGDGIYGSAVYNRQNLKLDQVRVVGNTGAYGGAIFNIGNLEIARSRISDNTFPTNAGFGGGVTNFGDLTLRDTQVQDNRGYLGGGVHNSGGTTEIIGGWVKDNEAYSLAGGYSNHNFGGIVTVSPGFDPNGGDPLERIDMLTGNKSDTNNYPNCYEFPDEPLCPKYSRETCQASCEETMTPCYYACLDTTDPSACRDQCRAEYLICLGACPPP